MTHPTDAAIAQAFRECAEGQHPSTDFGMMAKAIDRRARELDANYQPRINSGGIDNGEMDAEKGGDGVAEIRWVIGDKVYGRPTAEDALTYAANHKHPATPPAQAAEAVERAMDVADTIMNRLEGWDRAYPTDIFREVTDSESKWLHETRPGLIDRISAGMGRHMAGCIREDLAAIRAAIAAMQAGE